MPYLFELIVNYGFVLHLMPVVLLCLYLLACKFARLQSSVVLALIGGALVLECLLATFSMVIPFLPFCCTLE